MYVVAAEVAVGLPVINPFVVSKVNPAGRAGRIE